jgi:hypothetical protein
MAHIAFCVPLTGLAQAMVSSQLEWLAVFTGWTRVPRIFVGVLELVAR